MIKRPNGRLILKIKILLGQIVKKFFNKKKLKNIKELFSLSINFIIKFIILSFETIEWIIILFINRIKSFITFFTSICKIYYLFFKICILKLLLSVTDLYKKLYVIFYIKIKPIFTDKGERFMFFFDLKRSPFIYFVLLRIWLLIFSTYFAGTEISNYLDIINIFYSNYNNELNFNNININSLNINGELVRQMSSGNNFVLDGIPLSTFGGGPSGGGPSGDNVSTLLATQNVVDTREESRKESREESNAETLLPTQTVVDTREEYNKIIVVPSAFQKVSIGPVFKYKHFYTEKKFNWVYPEVYHTNNRPFVKLFLNTIRIYKE